MATRKRQKWALPYKRFKINVEDIGYDPFYLQHDIGFSGTKIYRPLERSKSGGFILRGNYGMNRKDAMAELKRLASGSQKNPSLSSVTGPLDKWVKSTMVRVRKTAQGLMVDIKGGPKSIRNPARKYVKSYKTAVEASRAAEKLRSLGHSVTKLWAPGHASRVKPVHLEWTQFDDSKPALVGGRAK